MITPITQIILTSNPLEINNNDRNNDKRLINRQIRLNKAHFNPKKYTKRIGNYSLDDINNPLHIPFDCIICYETVWNNQFIKCLRCPIKICKTCSSNLLFNAIIEKKDLKCPNCRCTFNSLPDHIIHPSNLNDITSVNIYIEDNNRIIYYSNPLENRRPRSNFLFVIFIIIILIVIIIMILPSRSN